MKYCASCKLVKEVELFSSNKAKATGLNTHCKSCYTENTREYQREYQKTRKAMKLSRVPSWANIEKIREIYSACPSGHHVDHIVPLQGKFVSGLHVETNLQYLPALENLRKHNKF
jgi:5-methylcytosine-specific restriction endonuclease McrA